MTAKIHKYSIIMKPIVVYIIEEIQRQEIKKSKNENKNRAERSGRNSTSTITDDSRVKFLFARYNLLQQIQFTT